MRQGRQLIHDHNDGPSTTSGQWGSRHMCVSRPRRYDFFPFKKNSTNDYLKPLRLHHSAGLSSRRVQPPPKRRQPQQVAIFFVLFFTKPRLPGPSLQKRQGLLNSRIAFCSNEVLHLRYSPSHRLHALHFPDVWTLERFFQLSPSLNLKFWRRSQKTLQPRFGYDFDAMAATSTYLN
jgi:hypothetical protein